MMASASSAGGTTYLLVPDTSGAGLAPLVRKVLASGDLDPTFGNGGVVRGPVASCFGCNLGVDDQNRVYVWGIEYQPGLSVWARVARFDENGRPDTTYGTNGVVSVQTSTQAIADIGPTGWFVVAESWMPRVTTVSPTGVTRAGFGGSVCLAFDVAVLPDGGSVVGSASCTNQPTTTVRATRFDNRGELVTTFGTHDDLMTDLPGVSTLAGVNPSGVRTLALDSQGRTYVVTNREVRRLTTAGLRDTTYGGGAAIVPSIPGSDSLLSVTMVDDLLHALIATDYRGGTGVVIAKLTAAGTPDASFGSGGLVNPSRYDANSVVPSSDYGTGRLLRSGSGVVVQSSMYVPDARIGRVLANGLLKLGSDGTEEPAYGDAGFVALRLVPVTTYLRGTFPGPSGSVYVQLWVAPANVQVLVRVTASGALDPTFSGDGWMPTESPTAEMTVDGAGRPVVYRTTSPTSSMSFGNPAEPLDRTITRYTTAGVPDTSFHAGDGAVAWPTATFPSGSMGTCEAHLTVLGDNSIVVTYPNQGPTTVCSTMFDKVTATGGLTQGWGSGYPAIAGATPKLDSVKPAPNGRAVLLVRSNTSGVAPRILRLNADGSADVTFGTGGAFEVADGAVIGQIDSLADGSVIVATTTAASMSFPDAAAWVRRYLPTGVQVHTGGYGASGSAVLDLTQHLIVANGRLVGSGWSSTGLFSVLREDATYDSEFPHPGDDGRAAFGSGASRDVYPVVSSGRGFAVTGATTGATVEIYKLAGTIG